MKALGENVPGYKIRDMIREVDLDENGTVEFGEFVEVRERWSVSGVGEGGRQRRWREKNRKGREGGRGREGGKEGSRAR